MFALFLIALLTATAVAAAGVLADSGLRWWSAFGALRRELKDGKVPALPALRPTVAIGGNAGFDRSCAARTAKSAINWAA
jgi:hypothetical protein